MRPEELEKAAPVVYIYGGVIYHMPDFSTRHEYERMGKHILAIPAIIN